MKISLFLVILLSSFSVFSQTQIIFVDIAGIDGEYIVPGRGSITQDPKQKCLLLLSAEVPFVNKTYRIGSSKVRRSFTEPPEFKIKFILEKSGVEVLSKLYNKLTISTISLFYDNLNGMDGRVEYLKYKFSNAKIISVIQNQEASGLLVVTVTFQYTKIAMGATSVVGNGALSLTQSCYDFESDAACNDSI